MMTTPPVTVHISATDLLVAAAIIDVRGRKDLADRLTEASREAHQQQPVQLTERTLDD